MSSYILLENGDRIQLEDGSGNLLLESPVAVYWHNLLSNGDANNLGNYTTDQAGTISAGSGAVSALHALRFDGTGGGANANWTVSSNLVCSSIYGGTYSGVMNFNGFNLTVEGDVYLSSAGSLTAPPLVTFNLASSATLTSNGKSVRSVTVDGASNFTVNGVLVMNDGVGTTTLTLSPTFTGLYTQASNAFVDNVVYSTAATYSVTGSTVLNGYAATASLDFKGKTIGLLSIVNTLGTAATVSLSAVSVATLSAATNAAGSLTINASGAVTLSAGGATFSGSAGVTFNGAVVLTADCSFSVASGQTVVISGATSGAFRISKTSAGILTFTGNSFAHSFTSIKGGVLKLQHTDASQTFGTGPVTLDGTTASGVLELSCLNATARTLTNALITVGPISTTITTSNGGGTCSWNLPGTLSLGNELTLNNVDNLTLSGDVTISSGGGVRKFSALTTSRVNILGVIADGVGNTNGLTLFVAAAVHNIRIGNTSTPSTYANGTSITVNTSGIGVIVNGPAPFGTGSVTFATLGARLVLLGSTLSEVSATINNLFVSPDNGGVVVTSGLTGANVTLPSSTWPKTWAISSDVSVSRVSSGVSRLGTTASAVTLDAGVILTLTAGATMELHGAIAYSKNGAGSAPSIAGAGTLRWVANHAVNFPASNLLNPVATVVLASANNLASNAYTVSGQSFGSDLIIENNSDNFALSFIGSLAVATDCYIRTNISGGAGQMILNLASASSIVLRDLIWQHAINAGGIGGAVTHYLNSIALAPTTITLRDALFTSANAGNGDFVLGFYGAWNISRTFDVTGASPSGLQWDSTTSLVFNATANDVTYKSGGLALRAPFSFNSTSASARVANVHGNIDIGFLHFNNTGGGSLTWNRVSGVTSTITGDSSSVGFKVATGNNVAFSDVTDFTFNCAIIDFRNFFSFYMPGDVFWTESFGGQLWGQNFSIGGNFTYEQTGGVTSALKSALTVNGDIILTEYPGEVGGGFSLEANLTAKQAITTVNAGGSSFTLSLGSATLSAEDTIDLSNMVVSPGTSTVKIVVDSFSMASLITGGQPLYNVIADRPSSALGVSSVVALDPALAGFTILNNLTVSNADDGAMTLRFATDTVVGGNFTASKTGSGNLTLDFNGYAVSLDNDVLIDSAVLVNTPVGSTLAHTGTGNVRGPTVALPSWTESGNATLVGNLKVASYQQNSGSPQLHLATFTLDVVGAAVITTGSFDAQSGTLIVETGTLSFSFVSGLNPATPWVLSVLVGPATASNVTVKNSNASGGVQILANDGTNIDQGGNTNWLFGGTPSPFSPSNTINRLGLGLGTSHG